MPPNDHKEVEDKYYQQLQDLVSQIPCHDINIVMGDMNTQIVGTALVLNKSLAHMHRKSAWIMATFSLPSVS